MPFKNNVFINCPFDRGYKPIRDAIVFTLIYLGYKPMLSETLNSGDSRILGIEELIRNSKYSIHDISRMEVSKKDELARFNMPFELGLDYGCKTYGSRAQKSKMLLILDKERFRYKKALSDLSGNDIGAHNNSPQEAMREVRNWIQRIENKIIPAAGKIWRLYGEFTGDFKEEAERLDFDPEDLKQMPVSEYCQFIFDWVDAH